MTSDICMSGTLTGLLVESINMCCTLATAKWMETVDYSSTYLAGPAEAVEHTLRMNE